MLYNQQSFIVNDNALIFIQNAYIKYMWFLQTNIAKTFLQAEKVFRLFPKMVNIVNQVNII